LKTSPLYIYLYPYYITKNCFEPYFPAFFQAVAGIAKVTAQIAAGQPDKDSWLSLTSAFSFS
jgi:hypothetical protein